MSERVIVSLTSYSKRICNLPVVLDTIFSQTLIPDRVVINLSNYESIPDNVGQYIEGHNIVVNLVKDTKVYKKLIPTLKLYPNDCIISIDDDFLYPRTMIEDFMSIHNQFPHYPISGNREVLNGMQCHCGCASLTKAEFMGQYLDLIDEEVIDNCPSDDIVYTFFSNMNGHPYVRTKASYFLNMTSYNEVTSYTKQIGNRGARNTLRYLIEKFGTCPNNLWMYYDIGYDSLIINDIIASYIDMGRYDVRSTMTYRLGSFVLSPFNLIRRFLRSE